jgi:hypothetical protein
MPVNPLLLRIDTGEREHARAGQQRGPGGQPGQHLPVDFA